MKAHTPPPSPSPRPRVGTLRHGSLGAVALAVLASVGFLAASADATQARHEQWSPEEQQFVYELNRSRWDPSAVLAAAGLAGDTVLPAPPLAVNDSLADAAGFRSAEMADSDYFAHQSPVTGDWPNAVARAFGYPLPALWPDEANSIESIHRGNPRIGGVLASFIGSAGHRHHVMGQGWYASHREIGVGARLDERTWTVLTATTGSADLFLTGVVYSDTNGNGRMDLDEGLAGVSISTGGVATITNPGGGWALRVAPGRYLVTASGEPFSAGLTVAVRVRQFNIEVDFVAPPSGSRAGGTVRPQVFSYQMCAGLAPTILGTGGDDILVGTPGDDVIVGGAGDDTIQGGGGDDAICAGPGADTVAGGPGRDRLFGGPGSADRCTEGERASGCELR